MSRPRVAFRPALLANGSGNDDATNRNFRDVARAIDQLQQDAASVAAAAAPSRVFVAAATGVGPWNFTGLNGDEIGLLGYEFELAIIDPTSDVAIRLNGDTGAHYGDVSGIPRNQADVGPNPGGPPGAVRGVVELRGVATGVARTIGCARVTSIETAGPSVSPAPGDFCWTGVAALVSASVYVMAGAAAATSGVKLFKIMQV